ALAVAEAQHPILRLAWQDGGLKMQTGLAIPNLPEKDRFAAGLATAPGGVLYVVNTQNDRVYRLSGQNHATQVSAEVGYRPYSVVLSPDGKTAAVSNWGGESVSLLDATTLKERARITVGSHPNELLYGNDGRLWVACSGSNSVSVIEGTEV